MALLLNHVEHVYGKGTAFEKVALYDINLQINEGEFIGLIGHTGSGKSTLIQHLNGLLKPTDGGVYYNGEDINEKGFSKKKLRSKVGIVFQYPEQQLFETTVEKDVAFGLKHSGLSAAEKQARVRWALETVGFSFEKVHDQPPMGLSGGEKRRVAIAGVIAMQPKCIVLDEPTAMLDPAGRREVIDTATKLCREQGITVVLITHHMEECIGADRVIVLSNGAIVADGAPKQVFSQVDLLKKEGLTAPVTVRLLHALRAHGMDVPLDALTVSDCADAVAAALKR